MNDLKNLSEIRNNPTKEKPNSLIPWLHQNLLDNLINNHYGKLI